MKTLYNEKPTHFQDATDVLQCHFHLFLISIITCFKIYTSVFFPSFIFKHYYVAYN